MFDFDLSDMPENPESLNSAGNRPTPGRGMAIVTKYEEYSQRSKGKAHTVTLEIVAWAVLSNGTWVVSTADNGRTHDENIYHEDPTGKKFWQRRCLTLAIAAGVVTVDQYQRAKAEGRGLSFDLHNAVGRPIMVEFIEEPDKNDPAKKYLRVGNIGLGWHHVNDPKVAAWPKDLQRLQRMGITATAAHAAVPQAKPVTRPPAPAAPAAPVPNNDDADPFGNVPF